MALVLIYSRIAKTAKKRRSALEGKSLEELGESEIFSLRVPYSEVSSAELRSGRLTIFYGKGKIRVKVLPSDLPQLEALLRTQPGERLRVTTT